MEFEPGSYPGVITGQGYSTTKNGVEQFFLEFEVMGKNRRAYFVLKTESNAKYFIKDMQRLGCPMKSFGQLDPTRKGFSDLKGIETEFTCEENEYNGKVSERWSLSRNTGPLEASPNVADLLQKRFGDECGMALTNAELQELANDRDDSGIPF